MASKLGKRAASIYKGLDLEKDYTLDEAVTLVKKNAKAKFDETVEVIMRLNVDPKYQDQSIRDMVSMPKGLGKEVKVLVFAKGEKAEEAEKAGADIVGSEELVEEVKQGKVQFDRCIATPDMMALVGTLGKVLGPKGLMPNPKLGTVTPDVATAVKNAKSGQVEFRADKFGIVHAGVAKTSASEADIIENIKALIAAVKQAKPTGVKGSYIKKLYLGSTMSPSLPLSLQVVN
jgi:large subunit ribosomal protein L1